MYKLFKYKFSLYKNFMKKPIEKRVIRYVRREVERWSNTDSVSK